MIVASDTSPLTSLAAIGHFELLQKLYGEIHIAEGVWQELNHGGRRHPGSYEVEKASWVYRHEAQDQVVTVLRRDLDQAKRRRSRLLSNWSLSWPNHAFMS